MADEGHGQERHSGHSRRQIPSLDQALQYSPFNSIIPFTPDIIATPESLPSSDPLPILSNNEQYVADKTISSLEAQTAQAPASFQLPRVVDHVLGDLRHLLGPDEGTVYNFTIPANARSQSRPSLVNGQTQTSMESLPLGSFAKAALDVANVNWRYSSSAEQKKFKKPEIHGMTPGGQTMPVSTVSTAFQSGAHNVSSDSSKYGPQHHHMQQPMVVVPALRPHLDGQKEASMTFPHQSETHATSNVSNSVLETADDDNKLPMAVIPEFPPFSDPSQYQNRPDLDAAILEEQSRMSKKRKREDRDAFEEKFVTDQREEADSAVQSFQEMLMEIFQAEDQLQADTSEATSSTPHKYFIFGGDSDTISLTLGPAALTTLEQAMTRLISLKRFEDLEVEQLAHLQRLSMASLAAASEIDLAVPEGEGEDSEDQWVRRVEIAENSLRSSRLLLRMMTASRNEKQLSSEEVIKEISNNLKHILDSAVLPLVEKRKSSEESNFFSKNTSNRQHVVSLMQRAGRTLKLIGDLVLVGDLSESSVTTIEFLATRVVFTENAPSDKESLLGVQKFEILRRNAMDVVAKVFFRHKEQREFLLSEILSSLEKLPVTRQSARQYKIAEGKPIQLVSALIMQLVQTSTMQDLTSKSSGRQDETSHDLIDGSTSEPDEASSSTSSPAPKSRSEAANRTGGITTEGPAAHVEELSLPASKNAESNASSVCHYLVQRALNSTKTGDQPYRNLLDIFTEDFLNVLGFAEWPAAEILLRVLLAHFLRIAGDDKSTAPAKNMALDLMGTIGSGIGDVRNHVLRATEAAEGNGHNLISDVRHICEASLSGTASPTSILHKDGPYRVVADYLQSERKDSLHHQSARSFFITLWARSVCEALAKTTQSDGDHDETASSPKTTGANSTFSDTCRWLVGAMETHGEVMSDSHFDDVDPTEARLFYSIVLLNMPLCRAFDRVFSVLLRALSSPHATVRSRGVKSVSQMVEKDATILDRTQHVMAYVVHATSDASPLVRDSALTLVGKCMTIKPALESDASKALISMSCDAAIGVRKRAMRLLRDLYPRNKNKEVRASIADAILRRLDDIEDSIVDLARLILEEIWLTPFYQFSAQGGSLSAQARHDLGDLAALIVATVARGEGIAQVLETMFKHVLGDSAKNANANHDVCRSVVGLLFESIIDNDQDSSKPSRKASLQALTIFAKSDPGLFDADQMVTLRPYIDNISFASDDLHVYRSIIVIYRRVLPVLPPLQKSFLLGVQEVLLNNITKLGKQELNEATACLWIINDVLQNTERLARVTISVLIKIESAKKGALADQKEILTMKRLIMLAGYFGKACDFHSQVDLFKEKFPTWKGISVQELIVNVLLPLTKSGSSVIIRESALDSICLVCQAWPKNFLKPEVSFAFRSAFETEEPRLVSAVLSGFRSFYLLEDERSKEDAEDSLDESKPGAANKLKKSMTVSDNDGAATSIAQQFLRDVLRIALTTYGDLAVIATDIITSTNRQGLVHPKECGPALVALETSPDPVIAKSALEEHRNLHSKHESMLDKEYVKAVEQAFTYQHDTIKDASGVDEGMNPKLRSFYDVLKSGNVALRKKLLASLCARINMDANKTSEHDLEAHLPFARFVLENLSLFEYGRVDEVLHLISCIEKIFSGSGNTLSHRVESCLNVHERFQFNMPVDSSEETLGQAPEQNGVDHVTNGAINYEELRPVTVASMILSMFWQTRSYLRRAWGLQSLRSGKSKAALKDVSKAPVRVASVSAEEHIEIISRIMGSLESEEKMIEQCRAFIEMLNVDNEFKVGSEEEGGVEGRYGTPSEDGYAGMSEHGSMGPPSANSKRGRNGTPGTYTPTPKSTPRKKGRPSLGTPRRSSKMSNGGDDDESGWD